MPHEPEATALLLLTCGLLLGVSVAFSRASERTGVPIALLFIVVGMLAGSEGLGGIPSRAARDRRRHGDRGAGRGRSPLARAGLARGVADRRGGVVHRCRGR